MRIRVLSVGRPRQRAATELHDDYAERIRRLGVRYRADSVREEKPGGRYSDAHVKEREGRFLEERLDSGATVVALDARGELLDSEHFAKRLERWATPCLNLLIGGPLGLDRGVYERADARWSLSHLTFPHELVRTLVAEQIYRALTILRGTRYHK